MSRARGPAACAGMEYALPVSFSMFGSSAVTFRTEYLHYDLGTLNFVMRDAVAPLNVINASVREPTGSTFKLVTVAAALEF